eukprot:3542879-Rhodomonas_salina.1
MQSKKPPRNTRKASAWGTEKELEASEVDTRRFPDFQLLASTRVPGYPGTRVPFTCSKVVRQNCPRPLARTDGNAQLN